MVYEIINQILLPVQPKINTNRVRKKVSKHKQEQLLNDWKLNRVKESEEWKKDGVKKKLEQLHKNGIKVIGSKYVKYKVTRKIPLPILSHALFK